MAIFKQANSSDMTLLNHHIGRLRDKRSRLASVLGISEWQIGRKI